MKLVCVFLVLSLVVMMAEPGDAEGVREIDKRTDPFIRILRNLNKGQKVRTLDLQQNQQNQQGQYGQQNQQNQQNQQGPQGQQNQQNQQGQQVRQEQEEERQLAERLEKELAALD